MRGNVSLGEGVKTFLLNKVLQVVSLVAFMASNRDRWLMSIALGLEVMSLDEVSDQSRV